MNIRTVLIISLCAGFLAGCDSRTDRASTFDHGLAQPPQTEQPAATKAVSVQPVSHSLAAGTVLTVRSLSVIDSSTPVLGFMMGTVVDDIKGADGKLAIPAGSTVAMMVRQARRVGSVSTLQLGLYSMNIGGHQYALTDGVKDAATLLLTDNAGAGFGHSTVHIEYGRELQFKLDAPVQLH